MTKRTILRKGLVGAVAIAIGVDATRGVKRKLSNSALYNRKTDSDGHFQFHDLPLATPNNWNDPELLEYFQNGVDVPDDEEQIPPPSPLLHFQESLLQTLNESSSNTRRKMGSDNWKDDTEEKTYSNYVEKETNEHYEELITEDDDPTYIDDTLPWPVNSADDNRASTDDYWSAASESMPAASESLPAMDSWATSLPFDDSRAIPTEQPTPMGSAFWNDLDNYEISPLDEQHDDYSPGSDDLWVNRINLKLSLGVVNNKDLNDVQRTTILEMALSSITKVLNEHSEIPFRIHDGIDKKYNQRGLKSDWLGGIGGRFEGVPEVERSHLADLILVDAGVALGSHNWWEMTVIYSVWKRPHRNMYFDYDGYKDDDDDDDDEEEEEDDHKEKDHDRQLVEEQQQRRRLGIPVKNESILTKIEGICNHAVEDSVRNGIYWDALHEVALMDKNLVIEDDMYYEDDKGLVDVVLVGDEYELLGLFCPMARPKDESVMLCPVVGADEVGSSMYDDAYEIPADLASLVDRTGTSEATYPQVIVESLSEIEWGDREWVGFALLLSTIVWTILLSLTAHFVFKKRKTQVLWGNALTPNGVDDILKVGWRVYEQPQFVEQAENPPQPQLFLQIYDKGKGIGYNDENSMLQGGVDRTMFAPNHQQQQ